MTENKTQVEEEKIYFVCLLDILGFENQFKNIGLNGITEKYKLLIKDSSEAAEVTKRFNIGGQKYLKFTDIGGSPINFTYFSDTVLFWIENPDHSVINETIQNINEYICNSVENNFPVRGAISYGEAVFDIENKIYIGQPIISCARAETSQTWIGVTFSKGWSIKIPISSDLVLPYSKHIKEGKHSLVSDIVLDFPRHWRRTRKTDLVEKLIQIKSIQIYDNDDEKVKIDKYYDNTIDFCRFSESIKDGAWVEDYIATVKERRKQENLI